MKKLLTAIILTAMTISLFGCGGKPLPEQLTVETEAVETSVTTVPETEGTRAEITTVPEKSYDVKNYKYQPPEEVLNTHFYSEDIEAEVEFEDYMPESYNWEKFNDEGYREVLTEDFYKHYPKEIVDDLNASIVPEIDRINEKWGNGGLYSEKEKSDCKIISIGCMMYDMNSDGTEDYIIDAWVSDNGDINYFGFDLCKIYLVQANGSYKSIDWENNTLSLHHYILSSKTNGLNDLLILRNGNKPEATYDGKDRYTDSEYLDEKHFFSFRFEQVGNNIVKCSGKLKSRPLNTEGSYIAAYFQDNPYLKENILYSCETDGTPKPVYGQYFEFYAELKDGATIPENYYFTPTEFRYIPTK